MTGRSDLEGVPPEACTRLSSVLSTRNLLVPNALGVETMLYGGA